MKVKYAWSIVQGPNKNLSVIKESKVKLSLMKRKWFLWSVRVDPIECVTRQSFGPTRFVSREPQSIYNRLHFSF